MELLLAAVQLFSQPWVWLIVIASILYGAGNYVDELLLSEYDQEVGTLVLISSLFGVVIAIGFFGYGLLNSIAFFNDTSLIFKALFIGFLEVLWLIPYLYATERSGAIIVGPLIQAVPIFALVLESFYGVIPPPIQIIGALIIVAGGILLSIEKEDDDSTKVNFGTLGLMALSTIVIAAIYVLFKDAALSNSFTLVGLWTGVGMFLTGTAIYIAWKPYRVQFNSFLDNANYKALAVQAGNEVLDAGGVYMTHLANTLGPSVMIVTAFNATQPIAVGVIGFLLSSTGLASISRDSTERRGWIMVSLGVGLIAVGVVVLALHSNT